MGALLAEASPDREIRLSFFDPMDVIDGGFERKGSLGECGARALESETPKNAVSEAFLLDTPEVFPSPFS